jgi:CheY-like chemotaxis protein
MPQFHPIIYSLADGGALGKTVEANDADEACRKAAASILDLSLPEVDRLLEHRQLEVIAVIKGDPQFEQTRKTPLFPGL